jgi:ribosomal protein S18 acetylase RimI-like enzyme
MIMLLTVDQANANDLPVVLDILDEAAAWLQGQGIQQWPAQFGGVDDWRSTRIAGYVDDGECWIVRAGGDPVATFNLTTRADPDYAEGWPEGTGAALYIYRMAVRRAWAGREVGTRILDLASARAHATGLSWLRLDCHRHNRQLQGYYEARGFIRVGTLVRVIDDAGTPYTRGSGALYQRPAGTMHHPSTTEGVAMTDPYDPQGEAAIWNQAVSVIGGLKRSETGWEQWNAALEQAARLVENEGRAVRQRNGMYYRDISGRLSTTSVDQC